MNTLGIELGDRSYPIHVGAGVLGRRDLLAPHVEGRRVLVVTNETVGPLYLDRLAAGLGGGAPRAVVLPDGERYKDLESFARILDVLVEERLARDCVIVALGGGVVGDVAGFAAACYQRGVDYVQVPTTLLAQVDSSVGGKTAVNHPGGKNLVGAFHQPVAVLSDVDTLRTLDARELRAGFAEVAKYGIVDDLEFFEWIEANADAVLGLEPEAITFAIRRSCERKAALVAADEREHGVRALLNLGHTFGHAIEAGLGYGTWLHGEAVAAGTCLAADLSVRLGWLDRGDAERIEALFARAGLPVRAPAALDAARLLDLMAIDKKVRRGRVRLVLLERLGKGVLTDAFDASALRATLERCRDAA